MKTTKILRQAWPKVRRVDSNGNTVYQVDARRTGTDGKREIYTDKQAALDAATNYAKNVNKLGQDLLKLSSEDINGTLKAKDLLNPFGKSILQAAEFYAAHLKQLATTANSKLISDLADEWFASKTSNKNKLLRPSTISDIRKHSSLLKKEFGQKPILSITEKDIQDYLDSLTVGQQRKYNIVNLTSQFFNWCARNGSPNSNPAKAISIEIAFKDILILSVKECSQLLKACQNKYPDLTLYIAISLFAGLRPTECKLLVWEDINLEEQQITVRATTSKIKETRNTPIEPTLLVWLKEYLPEEPAGFVTKQTNIVKRLQRLRAEIGYKSAIAGKKDGKRWTEDILRHSYASYWLAKYKDRAHLAENMGNSLKVIGRHYKQVVQASAANAFWQLTPKGMDDVLPVERETVSPADLADIQDILSGKPTKR